MGIVHWVYANKTFGIILSCGQQGKKKKKLNPFWVRFTGPHNSSLGKTPRGWGAFTTGPSSLEQPDLANVTSGTTIRTEDLLSP